MDTKQQEKDGVDCGAPDSADCVGYFDWYFCPNFHVDKDWCKLNQIFWI